MSRSVDIEIVLNKESSICKSNLIKIVEQYLKGEKIRLNSIVSNFDTEKLKFTYFIKSLVVGSVSNGLPKTEFLDMKEHNINWFVYSLDQDTCNVQTECTDDGDEIAFATHLTLPSNELFNLWENLYYDNEIKEHLVQYAKTMMEFSMKGVNQNVICCNRVILLHGPPGTGKTSLCKALAQKLSIKMQNVYKSAVLIEINSHSLFSKWFSESGKLVTNMFKRIKEICENEHVLVCVLLDEVETLAHARSQFSSGTEPSDAVRVVNVMLTQIDQIKKFRNVLILATSNMTESIDIAFVDRADIKQFLGLPSVRAIYKIYHSCLMELMAANIIVNDSRILDCDFLNLDISESNDMSEYTRKLIKICEKSANLSGRCLRKIPFLAHALYLNSTDSVHMGEFLDAMESAVEKEHQDRKDFLYKV